MSAQAVTRNYAYRMDHDTGFAPHLSEGWCTLCGCKTTTVERWAEPGSWVAGIGGRGTGRPDALVYAMEVQARRSLQILRSESPALVSYLVHRPTSSRVLVSRRFYYFGRNALRLPSNLDDLVIRGRGCKKIRDETVAALIAHLRQRGVRPGV